MKMQQELEKLRARNDAEEQEMREQGKLSDTESVVPAARSPSQHVATFSAALAANKWRKKHRKADDSGDLGCNELPAARAPVEWMALAARVKTPPSVLPGRRSHGVASPTPARVESAMSWNAAMKGDGGVAARALSLNMSWLSTGHRTSGSLYCSNPHGAGQTEAHLEPFFKHHEPSLDTSYTLPRAKIHGRRRAASDVRFGTVGTLAQHHRLTQERLLVARFVDELRRRNAVRTVTMPAPNRALDHRVRAL